MSKVRKQTETPQRPEYRTIRTDSFSEASWSKGWIRSYVLVSFPLLWETVWQKKGNWVDREVYFNLQSQPAMLEKSRQKLQMANHTTSIAKIKGWGMHACSLACTQLNFSILIQFWNPFIGNGATHTDLNMPIDQLNVGNPLSGLSSQVVSSCRLKLSIT